MAYTISYGPDGQIIVGGVDYPSLFLGLSRMDVHALQAQGVDSALFSINREQWWAFDAPSKATFLLAAALPSTMGSSTYRLPWGPLLNVGAYPGPVSTLTWAHEYWYQTLSVSWILRPAGTTGNYWLSSADMLPKRISLAAGASPGPDYDIITLLREADGIQNPIRANWVGSRFFSPLAGQSTWPAAAMQGFSGTVYHLAAPKAVSATEGIWLEFMGVSNPWHVYLNGVYQGILPTGAGRVVLSTAPPPPPPPTSLRVCLRMTGISPDSCADEVNGSVVPAYVAAAGNYDVQAEVTNIGAETAINVILIGFSQTQLGNLAPGASALVDMPGFPFPASRTVCVYAIADTAPATQQACLDVTVGGVPPPIQGPVLRLCLSIQGVAGEACGNREFRGALDLSLPSGVYVLSMAADNLGDAVATGVVLTDPWGRIISLGDIAPATGVIQTAGFSLVANASLCALLTGTNAPSVQYGPQIQSCLNLTVVNPPPVTYTLSLNTSPSGIPITVDAVVVATPVLVDLLAGTHTLSAPATYTLAGRNYQFSNWDDGSANPIRPIDILGDAAAVAYYNEIVPPPPPSYTLNINTAPSGIVLGLDGALITPPYSASLPAGLHTLEVAALVTYGGKDYLFSNWENGSTELVRIIDLQTNMSLTAYYMPAPPPPPVDHTLVVDTVPSGIVILVDGVTTPTPRSLILSEGVHSLQAPDTVGMADRIYAFASWEDGNLSPVRNIDLQADMMVQALYTDITPPPPPPPPLGATFVLSPASAVIQVGAKVLLAAIYDPDGPTGPIPPVDVASLAVWTSLNPAIATVSQGLVAGVGEGVTQIRCEYVDPVQGLMGATALVTVAGAAPPPSTSSSLVLITAGAIGAGLLVLLLVRK